MTILARIVRPIGPCLVGAAIVCASLLPFAAFADDADDATAAAAAAQAEAEAQAQAEAEAQAQAEAEAQAQAQEQTQTTEEDPYAEEHAELARLLAEEEARLLAEQNAEAALEAGETVEYYETEEEAEAAALEAQRKADEAGAAYDAAYEKYAGAIARLEELLPLQEELAAISTELPDAQAALQKAIDLRLPLVAERQKLKGANADLFSARVSASMLDTTPLQGMLTHFMSSTAASSQDGNEPESLLVDHIKDAYVAAARVVDEASQTLQKQISDARASIAVLDSKITAADDKRDEAAEALQKVIDRGNTAAFAIEKTAALVRQDTVDAVADVAKLDSKIDGVDELKETTKEWDAQGNELRIEALANAGAWYDTIDALAKVDEAVVYGTGNEFRSSKTAFVDKWGAAIDAFYDKYKAPLKGYGAKIAEQAYSFRIDPRLCAAISMVESSGGKECIKPHNAWGWGAADRDPEGLAVAWDSWNDAFIGWHKGMTETGYAPANGTSLTAMGDSYCSTPNWGSRVATFMEEISSYAASEQQ